MNIPLIWLKDYIDIDKSPESIAKDFTALGLMLDSPIKNNILDLEHRGDRSDWLSILGCARDISAMNNLALKHPKTYIKKGKTPTSESLVDIQVLSKDTVSRFNTRVFKNIKVTDSPSWLKDRLEQYGIPSINNIVDITNFVMVELGQPLHAQDLGKFTKREIVIRKARRGEKIETLLGEEIKLDESISVLSENDKAICITGIVGGKRTGVTKDTTEIVLDAGNYNQTLIRRSSRKLKIFNETVLRSDKFLHPDLTDIAIKRATELILELAGGEYYENEDYYPNPPKPRSMTLTLSRIKNISGQKFEKQTVKNIMQKLEYEVIEETPESLTLEIPYFRTDIVVEDDLVSDVLRINNYNNIQTKPINSAPPDDITSEIYLFEDKIRDIMVSLGSNEHITEPLTSPSENKSTVELQNSLAYEKSTLRTDLYQTLHPVADNYSKHGHQEAFIFEIGKTYHKKGRGDDLKDYSELRSMTAIFKDSAESFKSGSYTLRKKLTTLLSKLGIIDFEIIENSGNYEITFEGNKIGTIDLDHFTLDTEALLKYSTFISPIKESFTNHKSLDLSLTLNEKHLGPVISSIKKSHKGIITLSVIEDVLIKGKRSILIRVIFSNQEDPNKIKDIIANYITNSHKVEIK